MLDKVIQSFIDKILKANATVEQTARHEAGHRMMWRMTGEKPSVYAINKGYPCVMSADGSISNIVIKDMSAKDAGAMLLIKLGGIVSEMVGLDLDGRIDVIADFLADDYLAESPVMDWADDLEFGGDGAQVMDLLRQKGGIGPLAVNFARCLSAQKER